MKELLKELIKKALEELNVEAEIEISKPALPENGDYSSNIAMKLAKVLKKNPLEIANEIGVETNNKYGSNNTSYENGQLGGRVGGLMSKRLVEMGQQALLKQYNSKK